MEKKEYLFPETEIIELNIQAALLAGSDFDDDNDGTTVPDPSDPVPGPF